MNKIVSIKKVNAIFLSAILFAGIIALSSPSFIIGTVQAQPYYEMDNNYKKSYDKKDVSIKSNKCKNINLNVNGLELNVPSVPFFSGLLASESSTADEGERGSSSYGSYDGQSGSDNSFKFICINNSNNTVVGIDDDNGTTTPEPSSCEECFTTILTEEELNDLISATIAFTSLEEICNFIDTSFENESQRLFISEYLFNAASGINISTEKINAILDCLEEIYGVDFPRP